MYNINYYKWLEEGQWLLDSQDVAARIIRHL